MRRISPHVPRYKEKTHKHRHADSRKKTETSSSEEEDESTDSEESESTSASRKSERPQKDSFVNTRNLGQRGTFTKIYEPETYMHTRIDGTRIRMLDKVTQKNLLSPFPSFTIPPIYREIVRPRVNRGRDVRVFEERDERHQGKPPRHNSRKREGRETNKESSCNIHKKCEGSSRKSTKERSHKHSDHHSKVHRSERILTCVSGGEIAVDPRNVFKNPPEIFPGVSSKPAEMSFKVVNGRNRKTGSRETDLVNREGSPAGSFVNDSAVRDSPKKSTVEETVECEGGGEVREKLVYVVEEKGKDVRKVETDLFTLNEILAIKKDLLELSEFAKKLKRMKEMARRPENGENQQIPCHCKPASELLRDVNRRIEALEARQEELERETKLGLKGDVETQSKKETVSKASLETLTNTAEMPKPSATSTLPSLQRVEMILPMTDTFSNNSDIVNELMDIKTQLQKLEKRRMSKEVPENTERAEIKKPPKVDDRGIAVFSSKTYILAENLKKGKEGKVEEENQKMDEGISKSDRTKEDVANWLRSVSPIHEDTEINAWEIMKGQKKGGNWPKESQNAEMPTLKYEYFENQEQPKNRATGKGGREAEETFTDLAKITSSSVQCSRHLLYKECIVTPSGKIFARITKSITKLPKDFEGQTKPHKTAKKLNKIRPANSCSSIISVIHTKQHVGRLEAKHMLKAKKSKSAHNLSGDSFVCKHEKTARNTSLKNYGKVDQKKMKEKRHKESKNEFVKRLEAHMLSLSKTLGHPSTTSSSYSEFLASINLDTATNSFTVDSSGFQINSKKDVMMSYTATKELQEPEKGPCCQAYLDAKAVKQRCQEEKRKRKKQEAELKKMLKKQIKAYRKEQKRKIKEEKKNNELMYHRWKARKKKCERKCNLDCAYKKENFIYEPEEVDSDIDCRLKELEKTIPKEVEKMKCKEIEKPRRKEPTREELEELLCKKMEVSTTTESRECIPPWTLKQSDSLELYKQSLKKKEPCERINKKPCPLIEKKKVKNFMKSLNLSHPKFMGFYSPKNYHYKKKPKKIEEDNSCRHICNKYQPEIKNCSHMFESEVDTEDEDFDDDDDDDEDDDDEMYGDYCNEYSRHYNYPWNSHYGHIQEYSDCNHQRNPERFPNCGCVGVYLQTQLQRGWSGLRAPQKICTDTSTDVTSSRSTPSCYSNKPKFLIYKPKSEICLTAQKTDSKHKKKKKHTKSKENENHKKEHEHKHKRKHKNKEECHKKPKKDHVKKPNCSDESLCKCRKCGNVHCKGQHSDLEEEIEKPKENKKKKDNPKCSISTLGKSGGDMLPMFSFLSHFCKTKPRDPKTSRFSLKRLSEATHLKTCSNAREKCPPEKQETEKTEKHNNKTHKDKENHKRVATSSERSEKRKEKEEENNRTKKKEKCCCEECSGSRSSSEESRKTKKKKETNTKKKEEKKKKKKKCSDEDYSSESRSSSEESKKQKKKKKKKEKKSSEEECSCESMTSADSKKEQKKNKKKKEEKKISEKKCSSESKTSADSKKEQKKNNKEKKEEKNKKEKKEEKNKKEKKEENNKKEKKEEKKDKKCKCCECKVNPKEKNSETGPKETCVYYQTEILPSQYISDTPTSKTTATSVTSTAEPTGQKCSLSKKLHILQEKNKQIKEKLSSSFPPFWKNFGKSKTSECPQRIEKLFKKFRVNQKVSPDLSFIDDCSRSNRLPSHKEVTEINVPQKSIIHKLKKHKKHTKEKEKKEKKEKNKEVTRKSKPSKRRHT